MIMNKYLKKRTLKFSFLFENQRKDILYSTLKGYSNDRKREVCYRYEDKTT